MTKEKLLSLTKYSEDLKTKLINAIPAKHIGHPDTYKAFLKNELRMVTLKLESEKLNTTVEKK